jgi:hypothetical protein
MSAVSTKDYRYPVIVSEEIPYGDFLKIRSVLDKLRKLFPIDIPSSYVGGKECVQFLVRDHEKMCLPLQAYKTFVSVAKRLKSSNPDAYDKVMSTIRIEGVTGVQALPYHLDFVSGVPCMFLWKGTGAFEKFSLLLVGDYHVESAPYSCPACTDKRCEQYFPNVVDTIVKNTLGPVDLFLEFPFIDKSYKRDREYIFHPGTMLDTFKHFQECLQRDKKVCQQKWPNLRVHYSDIREDTAERPKTMIYITQGLELLKLKTQELESNPSIHILDDISKILHEIKQLLRDAPPTIDHVNQYIDFVFNFGLIKKQQRQGRYPSTLRIDVIGKTFFDRVLKHLKTFDYQVELQAFREQIEKTLALALKTKVSDGDKIKELHKELTNIFTAMTRNLKIALFMIGSLFIDTYLLLRLFKPYEGLKKQAIIYCGYMHIDFYQQVFKEMQFNMLYARKNIDISNFENLHLEKHKSFCLEKTGQFIL